MQRCVAIVWTRAGLPHDGCVDCDVCEYSVVDGLARYIVRILSYRRLTPQICTRSRETLCTRPTLAGTPIDGRIKRHHTQSAAPVVTAPACAVSHGQLAVAQVYEAQHDEEEARLVHVAEHMLRTREP